MRSIATRQRELTTATIDELAEQLVTGTTDVRRRAHDAIRSYAKDSGIVAGSLHAFYAARARNEVRGFSVPAINIRGMNYTVVRAIIRAAKRLEVGAFILEIARSELGYSMQTPDEFITLALAAALRERFGGPLFFQGDHYKIEPAKGVDAEMRTLEKLIDDSLAAGMRHIDIDGSKTVDLTKRSLSRQQETNGVVTSHLARWCRQRTDQPVIVGGEIGEIGGMLSTAGDLRAFMKAMRDAVGDVECINKVAVQTGTSHGGTPNPDGTMKHIAVDLATLGELSTIARDEFGLAGAVQHGASTLTETQIAEFPDIGAAEVHLSTEFQNIIFDHPAFPEDLREKIARYVLSEHALDRIKGQTDAQLIYKQRKHAWGAFKKELIAIPSAGKNAISHAIEEKVARLFSALRVVHTATLVKHYQP